MGEEETVSPDPGLSEDVEPLLEPVRELMDETLPDGVGWTHVLGSLALALLVLQAVTGILLSLYYSPGTGTAWESVRFIETEVTLGSLVRGAHHWGSSALVVVVVLHLLRVVVWGAYKRPRRVLWWTGCFLLLCVLGFGYTGYLLPWDMDALFGTRVGTGIPGSIPVVGPAIVALLRGGREVGELTLARFYALHVAVLPLLTLLGVGAHLLILRAKGITAPWSEVGAEPSGERTFYPHQAARDAACGLAGILVVGGLGWWLGADLGPKADPTNTSWVPRPEWYFYGLQHLQRVFPGWLAVVPAAVIPGLLGLALVALPWLDRSEERRPVARSTVLTWVAVVCAGLLWLQIAGWWALEAEETRLEARVAEDRTPGTPGTDAGPEAEGPGLPTAEDRARGEELFGALKCARCHVQGSIDDPLERLAPVDHAPSLLLEGSKVRFAWLVEYLREPHRIYYDPDAEEEGTWPTERMPHFDLSRAEARALAAFLDARVDAGRVPERWDPGDSSPERRARGEAAFRQYLCLNCHRLGDEGGRVGPDLTEAGERLEADWMMQKIENPYAVNPDSGMRRTVPRGEEAGETIRAIVDFLVHQGADEEDG